MFSPEETKLDNPVYHSLLETHKPFCIGYRNLLCYDAQYCPFGAMSGQVDVEKEMKDYARTTQEFYIVGAEPLRHSNLLLQKKLVCFQMICRETIPIETYETIVSLNGLHERELFELVNKVQPGYFNKLTSCLGNYYGIFINDELIAVTGERMKMNGFTEISAVVTDPVHTGKGYAKQLVAHAANIVISQMKVPFLHVAETNTTAISLYEKLGFTKRRKISFWHYSSVNTS